MRKRCVKTNAILPALIDQWADPTYIRRLLQELLYNSLSIAPLPPVAKGPIRRLRSAKAVYRCLMWAKK
ncbi:unnamed protein product [Strongylus vulgaris]|uniref:Uncharacterized protein n=1 Tax=Strongylus vulgaris TaxID=40348 RepID=A0A3P7IN46_STRVU|nr:unnamed protein product [Strongylus vulgaris]